MFTRNWSYRKQLLIILITVLALLFICAILIFSGDIRMKLTLQDLNETYPRGITSICCTLKNLSLRPIEYGEAFLIEHFVDCDWIALDDSEEKINFQLWIKILKPLESVEISYPVSLYSSFDNDGDYRVAIQVRAGKDYYTLLCPFSIK